MDALRELLGQPPERLALVALGVVLLVRLERWRCGRMIRTWCDANGYRLERARRSSTWSGRFPLASKHQAIYAITAHDLRLGTTRHGHALCGTFFGGLWSGEVRVEWTFSARELHDGVGAPPPDPRDDRAGSAGRRGAAG